MAAPSRYIVGYFRSLHFSAWIVACMLCPVNYIGQCSTVVMIIQLCALVMWERKSGNVCLYSRISLNVE